METEQEQDERYMQEAHRYYDTMQEIRDACRTFGMSRYEYAYHYCLARYGGFRNVVTVATTSTFAERVKR